MKIKCHSKDTGTEACAIMKEPRNTGILEEQVMRIKIVENQQKTLFDALIQSGTKTPKRGFSCQNRLKTANRNRLSKGRLASLIKIAIKGPLIAEFDFDSARQLFDKKCDHKSDFNIELWSWH